MFPPTALSSQRYKICFTRIQFLSEARPAIERPYCGSSAWREPCSQTKALPLGAKGLGFSACLRAIERTSTPPVGAAAVGPAHSPRTSEAGECHHVLLHATRLPRPQLLSEAQMPRSSRNRSIGAELASARMR